MAIEGKKIQTAEELCAQRGTLGEEEAESAAWEICRTACETGDTFTLRKVYQTGLISSQNLDHMLRNAVPDNHLAVVQCLFELGATLNKINSFGIRNCRSLEIFKLLAQSGYDFAHDGINILIELLDYPSLFEWFLSQGVDINGSPSYKQGTGEPPFDKSCEVLNLAAMRGDIELFEYLVSRGADPGRSMALHRVAGCEDAAKTRAMIVHLIEKYKFDVNADDTCNGLVDSGFGRSLSDGIALNSALLLKNFAAVEIQLNYGADPNRNDSMFVGIYTKLYDEEPDSKMTAALKMLLEAGADPTSGLYNAMSANYVDAAKLCLEYGADRSEGETYLSRDPDSYAREPTDELRKLFE